jgi:hypothetical protein
MEQRKKEEIDSRNSLGYSLRPNQVSLEQVVEDQLQLSRDLQEDQLQQIKLIKLS